MILPPNSKIKLGRCFQHARHISWPKNVLISRPILLQPQPVAYAVWRSCPSAHFLDLWAWSSQVFSRDVSPSFPRDILCVIQHRNRPILRGVRPRSKRTPPPMPVPMSSVQAQILMNLFRASDAVTRSEVVEPCAATCFVRGCDEMRLSVDFVTVGFLGICRQYCCD